MAITSLPIWTDWQMLHSADGDRVRLSNLRQISGKALVGTHELRSVHHHRSLRRGDEQRRQVGSLGVPYCCPFHVLSWFLPSMEGAAPPCLSRTSQERTS